MRWLIFSIVATILVSLAGLGFVAYNFDPFRASAAIRVLFLLAGFLAIAGLGTCLFYYIEMARNRKFAHVFFARALRRGILLGFLSVCKVVLLV